MERVVTKKEKRKELSNLVFIFTIGVAMVSVRRARPLAATVENVEIIPVAFVVFVYFPAFGKWAV